ncbi:MAG TPA: glycosyltransferase [Candidatus Sulfotelmatobacter sp.]|nr:glycosyltransferase [Candidatus Sulfotelmatobacter sp.]
MLTPSQSNQVAANQLVTVPVVTMIVLCYNQSRFVLETLESVKAQTYKSTELIIIDDCSTDDSVAVIERWLRENEIQCIFIRHEKNQGICKSLNEALAITTGKYISMIASDDIWLTDKIERQVEIMESQPESVGVLYSDAFQIDEDGNSLSQMLIATCRKLSELPQGQILSSLLEGNFIGGQAALVRRSCYDEVGLYDENLPWEDWDMWMRIARRYTFLYSPAPSAKYRIHQKSFTRSDPARMLKDSVQICLKQFRLGDLTDNQKSTLAGTLVNLSEELYKRNDVESARMLLAIWRATRHKRAGWMYRFARFGVSFRNWQRADSCRIKLRHFYERLRKSQRHESRRRG